MTITGGYENAAFHATREHAQLDRISKNGCDLSQRYNFAAQRNFERIRIS